MSGIHPSVPQIPAQPGLSTPSDEWAHKTTSMLDPDTTNTASSVNPTTRDLLTEKSNQSTFTPHMQATLTNSSTASTPGVQVPGAYLPDPAERAGDGNVSYRETASRMSESVQQAAHSMGTTAASYLPAAAQYLPTSVVETVAGYLPNNQITEPVQASTHDVLHQKSLPSQEVAGHGSNERVAGVGALPGSIAESGVARLPDDQSHTSTPSASNSNLLSGIGAGAGLGAATGVFGGVTEKAKDVLPSSVTGINKDLPTTENPSSSHNSGVGSLPGANTESGVAVLPDEKFAKPSTGATDPSVGTHRFATSNVSKPSNESGDLARGATAVGGVGTLPGGRNETGVAQLPDEKSTHGPTPTFVGGVGELKPVTLPSQEPYGNESLKTARDGRGQGVQEGVGSLVGSSAESGVAKVPDERAHTAVTAFTGAPLDSHKSESHKNLNTGSDEKESSKGMVGAAAAGAKKAEEKVTGHSGLPNKDESNDYDNTEFEKETRDHPVRQHSQPHLPSSSSPAPRQEYLMDLTKPQLEVRKHALGADGAVWFGTKIDVEGARSEYPSVDDTNGSGYQTDYHPAELHPPTNKTSTSSDPTTKGASEAQKNVSGPDEQNTHIDQTTGKPKPHVDTKKEGISEKANETSHSQRERDASPSSSKLSGEGKKKVGFMEKMKGEAKVLLGKVEGKHEKVEEGRRMKAGENN